MTDGGRVEDGDGEFRLPLSVTPGTNGEYIPDAPSQFDLDVGEAALAHADDAAHRAGMDRRRFLQTAGGVAAVLATIDLAGVQFVVEQSRARVDLPRRRPRPPPNRVVRSPCRHRTRSTRASTRWAVTASSSSTCTRIT